VSAPALPDQGLPPKPLMLAILAGLGMLGPFSIDMVFPAFAQMQLEFGTNETAMQQVVSVYLLAFAAMSLFHGSLADALGRKPVMIVGGIVYLLASIGCALAPSLWVLLLFRALQGMSAGAGQIVSRAVVRDLFADAEAQRIMAQIAMIFGLAPAIAPIVGGWLLAVGPWRYLMWFLVAFSVVLFGAIALFLPETHPESDRTPLRIGPLFRTLWSVWRDPDGRRLALNAMLNFSGMWLYIASAPLFVVGLLGKGEQDFWLLFVPLISGMILGSFVSGRLAGRMSGRRLATLGYYVSLAGGAINVVLTLFPATARLPWAVLPLPIYTFGVATAFPIITLAMLDRFPHARGAAASVQAFISLIFNALTSAVVVPLVATALWHLSVTSLLITVASFLLWQRHLRVCSTEPATTDHPELYEGLDEV
jgi:MFS transporter, DHA1 family, multidrug resistance protein